MHLVKESSYNSSEVEIGNQEKSIYANSSSSD